MADGTFYPAGYQPGGPLSNEGVGSSWGNDSGWSDNYDYTGLNPDGTPSVDPGAPGYVLNRGPTGAQKDVTRYQSLADAARNGVAPQADFTLANQYRGMGDQARQQQLSALALQQQAATGQAPSYAAQMMQMGNDQAMRNQLALAGSARGAGAMGASYYNAGQNVGALQAQNIAQTGALRAQEMAQARDAYMQGASGIRGQDYGMYGTMGQQALAQAQLREQQNALNAQTGAAYEQLGYNVNNAQLNANLQEQALQQGQWSKQADLDQHSTDSYNPMRMFSLSDARAKTDIATESRNAARMEHLPSVPEGHRRTITYGAGDRFAYEDKPIGMAEVAHGGGEAHARQSRIIGESVLSDERAKEGVSQIVPPHHYTEADERARFYDHRAAVARVEPASNRDHDRLLHRDAGAQEPSYYAAPGHERFSNGLNSAAGGLVSDERAKEGVTSTGLHAALMAMRPVSFSYKAGVPGETPGVRQAGILAQDAERTQLGSAMVEETPYGKAISVPKATSLSLAAAADHERRLAELERGRR